MLDFNLINYHLSMPAGRFDAQVKQRSSTVDAQSSSKAQYSDEKKDQETLRSQRAEKLINLMEENNKVCPKGRAV